MTREDPIPEVRLIPNILGGFPRLECHFGWNEDTTKAIKNEAFEILVISGGNTQNFHIPELDQHAQKITALRLQAQGNVQGLDQFNNTICRLEIIATPQNHINIHAFEKLKILSVEWESKIENQIHEIKYLDSLFIRYYKYQDIKKLQSIGSLKELTLSQGNVTNIIGINPAIESLDFSYLKNYSDTESINKLKELKWLNCVNINKATGVIGLGTFKNLSFARFVNTNCTLDLESIDQLNNLEKLWSNGEHINLNWQKLLLLPKLKMVGLFDSKITDQEIISIVENSGRKIEKIYRSGTKKRPHIQITFFD